MKIVKGFPPNKDEIEKMLGIFKGSVYCWGDVLYTQDLPAGEELPEDILIHEEIHQKQQEKYATPEYWWTKYLYNKEFRQGQEVEAFQAQYRWVKEKVTNKIAKECLFDLACNLRAPMYGLLLSHQEAEYMIRR